MSFGGFPLGGKGLGGTSSSSNEPLTPEQQQMQMVKTIQAGMESCPVKTVISGGMGFGLGAVFGLFMASMSYDTPMTGLPGAPALQNLPLKEQLKRGFKDMGQRSYSTGKNFALVGSIFAGTECCIEGFRAKNDMYNGISAGCVTGGFWRRRRDPRRRLLGVQALRRLVLLLTII
ncbi:Tim17/Tim22/Tim23/Pmp24 family-domain-containing protein [Tuber borchii]|uniref:Mitochondrial import inner membrane translocase subunit TIM22 n=1 Tax=Tuber borchii TaxID=42251 RepID=A0A2T6ZX96_TUBBO|nr:Tim17/Tim22/Tim23/Pmp24 family-domain-containing protein [Tuber borchii]